MKPKVKHLFHSALLFTNLMIGCVPPSIPNYDIGTGKLIFKDTCQGQAVYLLDIAILNTYKSGYSYSDTLTVGDTTYFHVVRLDARQSDILSKKSVYDKINIEFDRGIRNTLPKCNGFPVGGVETVNVFSIRSVDYQ